MLNFINMLYNLKTNYVELVFSKLVYYLNWFRSFESHRFWRVMEGHSPMLLTLLKGKFKYFTINNVL